MKDFIYNFTLRVTWKSCISLQRKLANAGGEYFLKYFFPVAFTQFTPLIISWNPIDDWLIFHGLILVVHAHFVCKQE